MVGSRKLLTLCILCLGLNSKAQVSSENYIQMTERISSTQVLSTTEYYDGLGRPFEKVEHKKAPDGGNLIHLQQYDGLGRDWKTWLPVKSSSDYLSVSDASTQVKSQYKDSHAYSLTDYDGSPLNRVISVEGVGEEWTSHPVKTEYLINTGKFPLNCKYYRVSMQGQLQDNGYYPEGRLYVTKTTNENGHESYEFKNIAGNVILKRTISSMDASADTYYVHDYRGNLSFTAKSLLLVNFYDDYAFIDKCTSANQTILRMNATDGLETAFPSNAAPNAKGYLTGKKVYTTDGTNRYIVSSMYYGLKGRVVQTHSNNLIGGSDHFYTSYTYAGSPLKSKHVHYPSGKRAIQETYDYAYDSAGRQTMVSYTINGSAQRVLSSTVYDGYGRISKQTLLGKETVSNSYNIRSWKTATSSPNFTQKLAYNKSNGSLSPSAPQYNGNISAMSWKAGSSSEKGYKFSYNRQDMLTDADYGEGAVLSNNQGRYDESLSYDKMGNILSLMRYGLRDDGKYGLIDNLSYGYNGNQLIKVDDTVSGPYYAGAFHFVDGVKESTEYSYDANGNMVKDKNKGISSISYDINNLPRQILYKEL